MLDSQASPEKNVAMVRGLRLPCMVLFAVFLVGVRGADVRGADDADGLPLVQIGIVFDGPPPGGTGVVPERLKGWSR